jgi:hypothetical protein
MKVERIIVYPGYIQKGISLYKVNDFDYRSYITIDKSALIKMIEDEGNEADIDLIIMISYHFDNFTDEQLKQVLARVKEIINHNERYKTLRKVKDIKFI